MMAVVVGALPEIGVDAATRFITSASILAGAIWTHAHPTASIVAAFSRDPEIADLRLDFETDLREALQTLLYGVLPGPGREHRGGVDVHAVGDQTGPRQSSASTAPAMMVASGMDARQRSLP